MDNSNIELIRSHMDTIILRTLQNDDKYGLEMLNEIRSLSDELYSIKQPTLYSSLKRLESQGLILSYPGEETKGANRTYYRLTDEGREFLEADQKQWEFSRTIIDKLLSDKEFDKSQTDMPFDPSEFRPLTKRTKKESEPKVVYKYIEVEKPVYVDSKSGNVLQDFNPENTNIEQNSIDGENQDNEDTIDTCENICEEENNILDDNNQENINNESNIEVFDDLDDNFEENIAYNDDNENLQTTNEPSNTALLNENLCQEQPVQEEYSFLGENTANFNDNNNFASNEQTKQINENENLSQSDYSMFEGYHFDIKNTENTEYQNEFEKDLQKYNASKATSPYDAYIVSNKPLEQKNAVNFAVLEENDANNAFINDDVDYVNMFADNFSKTKQQEIKQNTIQEDTTSQNNIANDFNEVSMSDLQKTLSYKDIKLKPYSKSNTIKFYSGKFYYSNQVLRDWSIITYLLFAGFFIASYFLGKNYGVGLGATLGVIFSGLILPIVCISIWAKSPLRKKRNNFAVNNALLTSIIVVIALVLVILIIGFFILQIDTNKPSEYIPTIVVPMCSLVLLPISVVIYALLFKVKKYHLR